MTIVLDMRTILLFGVLTAALAMSVTAPIWLQNRGRFQGMGLWFLSFAARFVAWTLIFFRDAIPDFFSILVGNAILMTGVLLLLMGLELFVGEKRSQRHNYIILVVFVGIHAYFTFVQPDLTARVFNYSFGSLIILGQASWLMFRQGDPRARRDTRWTGLVLSAISAIMVFRIAGNLVGSEYRDLLQSGPINSLAILGEMVLWVGLAFALLLMVNRRLVGNLEDDIVQRGIIERSLRSSEEKFELAFRSVPDAIVVTSLEGRRVIEVNGGVTELFGYEPEEVTGASIDRLNVWVNADEEAAFIAALRANGRAPRMSAQFRTKSGETFPGILSGELIDIDGETCIVVLIHDDTESQRVQTEMRRMNAELEQRVQERTEDLTAMNEELTEANHAKSDFLAAMSHELRTPLNSIIGFSGILEQELAGPLNPEQKLQLGMLHSSGQHLLALVDDILDLARIESGKVAASCEQFEAASLIEAVLGMIRPLAEEKELALTSHIEPGLDQIYSDPRLVTQILTNLLGNAIKFTASGSVALNVSAQGEWASFQIVDTGRGVAESELPRITEKFFQAQPENEAKNPGAGLGLAITAQLAEIIGARIEIESELGVGSTFTLRVPLLAAPEVE